MESQWGVSQESPVLEAEEDPHVLYYLNSSFFPACKRQVDYYYQDGCLKPSLTDILPISSLNHPTPKKPLFYLIQTCLFQPGVQTLKKRLVVNSDQFSDMYFEFLVIFDHSTAGWNRLKGWPEPFWRFWRENSKTTAILLIGSNLLCTV